MASSVKSNCSFLLSFHTTTHSTHIPTNKIPHSLHSPSKQTTNRPPIICSIVLSTLPKNTIVPRKSKTAEKDRCPQIKKQNQQKGM
ncbi:uncharacterized protein LY89DRAFT_492309 [Mollisia scopiformis]|uniref:Uncharacterized protein n=1 Tax=Mollisia scopiformis TaxID=149040 RepID=A0A194XH84_MOLSC|nr:uncharacterized protein LY89DRAFT_492309 [Mollisia scopiformis]KUJ19501.1 hypothetical protein LY89DRAFT_492309 [Mollisia scopiformis]